MNRLLAAMFQAVLGDVLVLSAAGVSAGEGQTAIDRPTLDRWSAPYRNWHYWPEHVIPADPKIPGYAEFKNTDCPCVYQLPGEAKWTMSFIGFDGKGYNSFVAVSDDLVRWEHRGLAMGFGPPGQFDHGGCVVGAYLYESYDVKAPRVLKRRDGKFWTLYGCYPRQGGYELRPGYEGVASSEDGLHWRRAKESYILSVHDPDCGRWEKDCIYQPWLVEHEGRFFDFYNAANGGIEQMGMARSSDLLTWTRHPGNPVVRNRPGAYDEQFCSDGKVFRDGDHWVMFYFGVGRGGAHVMAAFSRDLIHWTAHPEPLYKAGGHPQGLDRQYAHKISLVYNPKNDTFYMHYCACGTKGRGIGLITSKPIGPLKAPGGAASAAAPCVLTSADTMEEVFRDEPWNRPAAEKLAIEAAKEEVREVQLVVAAARKQDLHVDAIEVSDPAAEGGAAIARAGQAVCQPDDRVADHRPSGAPVADLEVPRDRPFVLGPERVARQSCRGAPLARLIERTQAAR